jgi:hypothetical protein
VALHAQFTASLRTQTGVGWGLECDRRKRRSVEPKDLRSVRTSHPEAYRIVPAGQRLPDRLFGKYGGSKPTRMFKRCSEAGLPDLA